MMTPSDIHQLTDAVLCERLVHGRDAAAIAEIVRRYGGFVYGTCLRWLPPEAAANACVTIIRNTVYDPVGIQGALSVWLHQQVMRAHAGQASCPPTAADATWLAVAPHIDQAFMRVPKPERAALFQAWALASGPGVSDKVASGENAPVAALTNVAKELAEAGCQVSVDALTAACTAHIQEYIPSSLAGRLAKVALSAVPDVSAVEVAGNNRLRLCLLIGGGLLIGALIFSWYLRSVERQAADVAAKRARTAVPTR